MIQFFVGEICLVNFVLTYRMHPQLGTSWQLWWSGLSLGLFRFRITLAEKNGGYQTTYKSWDALQVRLVGFCLENHHSRNTTIWGRLGFCHFFALCCPKKLLQQISSFNLEITSIHCAGQVTRSPAISKWLLGEYPLSLFPNNSRYADMPEKKN